MTDRLLTRSASKPAGSEITIKGIIRMIWAMAVCSCPSTSLTAAATASRITSCFQALSLNVPRNCAMNSPRIGWAVWTLVAAGRSKSAPLSTSAAPFARIPSTHVGRQDLPIPLALTCSKAAQPEPATDKMCIWNPESAPRFPQRRQRARCGSDFEVGPPTRDYSGAVSSQEAACDANIGSPPIEVVETGRSPILPAILRVVRHLRPG